MKINQRVFITLTAALMLLIFSQNAIACNEEVCAGIVSKCMLTDSCNCDLKECECCKECFKCLSYLYSECCSCVDMCPTTNSTSNVLSKKSHVEELESIPGLFKALTEDIGVSHDDDEDDDEWSVFTFPIDADAVLYDGKRDSSDVKLSVPEQELDTSTEVQEFVSGTVNCTVVFLMQCLSWNKCKANCQSMGAMSYRWFHDGCCECVGSTCLNYGINDNRCGSCPMIGDEDLDALLLDEDELDYGEEFDNIENNN